MTKVIIILIIGGVLAGCSTPEQPKPACTFVAGRTIPVDSSLTVRAVEIVKVYKTGRRIDPNNPNIMHEAGEIYVINRSPTWNTRPNTPVTDPSFNNRLKPVNIGMENLSKQQALLRETNRVMKGLVNQMMKSRGEINKLSKAKNSKDFKAQIEKLKKEQANIIRKLAEFESK